MLVLLGYPQLVLVKLLGPFLHPHLLVEQFSLVMILQLADLLLVRVGELDDGLLFGEDDFVLLLDGLLQFVDLLMRVGYLRLQVVDLSNELRPLIPEVFLDLDVVPLIDIFLALEAEDKRIILIFELRLPLLMRPLDILHLNKVAVL